MQAYDFKTIFYILFMLTYPTHLISLATEPWRENLIFSDRVSRAKDLVQNSERTTIAILLRNQFNNLYNKYLKELLRTVKVYRDSETSKCKCISEHAKCFRTFKKTCLHIYLINNYSILIVEYGTVRTY